MKQIRLRYLAFLILLVAVPYTLTYGQVAPVSAADYRNRAVQRDLKGDIDGAMADYNKAIQLDPQYLAAYLSRGFTRESRRDLDGAMADYNRAIEINPRYALAYSYRGSLRDSRDDHNGAMADFTKIIEIDPRNSLGYFERADLREKLGDHDGAIADLTKEIENYPEMGPAYTHRGDILRAKGDLNGAIADYTRAIEAYANDMQTSHNVAGYSLFSRAYEARASIERQQGKNAEAQADLDAKLKIDAKLDAIMAEYKASKGTQTPPASDPRQKTIHNQVEYDAYMAAYNLTDPAPKAAAMEAFATQYPMSVMRIEALGQALASYQQAGNAAKFGEIANRTLQVDPDNIRAFAVVTYLKRGEATASGDAKTAAAVGLAGERGLKLLSDRRDSEGLSEADSKKLISQLGQIFNGAIGYSSLQAKDYARAREYFRKSVQLDPADLQNVYQLGIADTSMSPMDTEGFWYLARAIGLARGQSNAKGAETIETYAKARYKNFHGSYDGWDKVVAAAATQTAPPVDFAHSITAKPTPAEVAVAAIKENDPATMSFSDWEFVLSLAEESPANTQAAEKVWQAIMAMSKNGTAKLQIEVKVISATNGNIRAAITDENQQSNTYDVEVWMAKPMVTPPAPGSVVKVIGLMKAWKLRPFRFVMTDGELP